MVLFVQAMEALCSSHVDSRTAGAKLSCTLTLIAPVMLTIAHITDLHIAPLPHVTWRQITNKRALGYVSWHRKRKHEHRAEVLDALCRDIAAQQPDQICITGDVTNLGLPAEYARAPAWFQRLGSADRVSVILGNHDTYVRAPAELTTAHWTPWLAGDDGRVEAPTRRRRGPVSLIGVNTAVPTPPFLASGRVGAAQLARLSGMLAAEREAGQTRVVLLHHPVQSGVVQWRKSLHDADKVRRILAEQGAELVLHGHMHTAMTAELPGPDGPIPVHGAGSASIALDHKGETAQYNIVRVARDAAGLHIRVSARRYDAAREAFAAEDAPVAAADAA
jgi:3',5'-cyclic AMP phosphodiesterase CpdA